MPDLNLMDEGGFEESSSPAPTPARRKAVAGGGGGLGKFLIVVVILIIVGGGLFLAQKKGWVKLPFMKKAEPKVTQLEETYPEEQLPMADQKTGAKDTTEVALLETPPVEEKKTPPVQEKKGSAVDAKTEQPPATEMDSRQAEKLNEMSGRYTIQVFSFHDKKTADEIVERLNEAGYPAYATTMQMKEGEWFAVRIGKYPTRQEARKAVENFALELRSSYFIDKVRN